MGKYVFLKNNNKQKTLPLSEPDTIIINNYFQRIIYPISK